MTGWSTSPKSRRASRTRRSTSWSVASGLTRRRQWRSFGQALALSDYPESFPRDFRVAYRPTPRELVIGCRLPPVTVIPVIRDYRYVKARSEIDELPRPMKEIKDLYASVIHQVALRTMWECFCLNTADVVDSVVFNGTLSRAVDQWAQMRFYTLNACC